LTPTAPPLTGRVGAVSGGGRGIGAEIAGWLARDGAAVAICGRNASDVDTMSELLRSRFGADVLATVCDVGDPYQVDRWIAGVVDRFGRLDMVVANAAVLGPIGDLPSVDMTEWLHTLAVDVGGVAAVARSAIPTMVSAGYGRIIALSGGGLGGPRPLLRASSYVAAKAAVIALVEVVAAELAGTGVTMNAIAPGPVPTGFLDEVLRVGEERAGADLYLTAANRAPADLTSLGDLISYVLSEDADWLSGRCLSTRWENPSGLRSDRGAIETGSRYRLRRIDEDLYGELTSAALGP
jgi:NAD(P)-dependent dehydrogenase (short-subunit alcohol dehydrogenase family)